MHPVVDSRRQQLAALCSRLGVRRLELFGSAARQDFDEDRSDLDFLVDLGANASINPIGTYFELKSQLESLFGRPVDLVSQGSIRNPYVLATINRDRQLLYAE